MMATNGRRAAKVVKRYSDGISLRWSTVGAVYGIPFTYVTFYTWDELEKYGLKLVP